MWDSHVGIPHCDRGVTWESHFYKTPGNGSLVVQLYVYGPDIHMCMQTAGGSQPRVLYASGILMGIPSSMCMGIPSGI